MHLGIHGRAMPTSSAPMVADVVRRITDGAGLVTLSRPIAEWLRDAGQEVPAAACVADSTGLGVDVMVSLGGDGSLLDAVELAGAHGTPILGINMGRLGFLSNVKLDELDRALEALRNGRYRLEERSMLEVKGLSATGDAPDLALNEVGVHKRDTAAMIAIHTYLDDRFLNTYWSDGLIIATPTGSTAYSLSCGGPLMDPTCHALVITPIAPHNLNVRPFVVPDNMVVTLMVETRGDRYLVNRDARSTTMGEQTPITIRKALHPARLVQFEGMDFLDTLRTKLNWGLDARSAPPRLPDIL